MKIQKIEKIKNFFFLWHVSNVSTTLNKCLRANLYFSKITDEKNWKCFLDKIIIIWHQSWKIKNKNSTKKVSTFQKKKLQNLNYVSYRDSETTFEKYSIFLANKKKETTNKTNKKKSINVGNQNWLWKSSFFWNKIKSFFQKKT